MKSTHKEKRFLIVLTAAIMIMTAYAFAPRIGTEVYAESSSGKMIAGTEVLKNGVNTADAKLVHYGDRYWYVIGYDGEGVASGSGKITLLSKNSIKSTPFDKDYNAVYSSSNLKKDIEAYAKENLSAGEKSAIAPRDLSAINARKKGDYEWWFNNFRTVDEVLDDPVQGAMLWPLSAKEACEVNAGIRKIENEYWLRSLGVPECKVYQWYGLEDYDLVVISSAMATVWADGSVDIQAEKENTTYWKGMRPAFNLKKSDIVMVSAATGGKESAEDGILTEAGEVTEKNLKLTLKDDVHKDFYVNPCDVSVSEAGLTVKYSSAVTGEKEYISAIIKGADGSIKQYGRLAKATEASGTATIKGLPTDTSGKISLPEGDKLYVFNEQYNGDEKTDYASNLTEIHLTGHDWVFDNIKYDTRTGDVTAEYHCSIDGNHFTEANGDYGTERTEPTCEEPGKEYEVLSISAGKSPDGKAHKKYNYRTDYAPASGHTYNRFFGFRWTGNATDGYSKAEAIFACTRDPSHVTYVDAVVTSKEQKATCEGIGRTLYQANLSADKSLDGKDHGEAKYAQATKKLGHDWGEPTYEWSTDNKTVTAKRVCKRDDTHVETETVETEITKVTEKPTCKATGKGDFKTKPFTNEAFKEQTKTGAEIPKDPDAHAWDDGEQQGDPNSCGGYTTIYRCTLCETGHKEEITGGSNHDFSSDWTYFPEPTCTESGQRFHECTKCGAFNFDEGEFEVLDPKGHKWNFVDFTWTGDETKGYTKAVANFECEHNPSHTMTANAEISEEVTEPTCKAGGKTVYTACISAAKSPDEKAHSESKDAEATEPIPHEWKYDRMEWTGNKTEGYTKAHAVYKCKYGCGKEAKVEAHLDTQEYPAGCEVDGVIRYTATVEAEDSLTGDKKSEKIEVKTVDAIGHDWDFTDVVWTGDEENGFTKAEMKFVCNNSGSRTHTKLVEAPIKPHVIEPTCFEEGYTVYEAVLKADASPNGIEYTDYNAGKYTKATGHDWGTPKYTWSKDNKSVTAQVVCKNDSNHTGRETVNTTSKITKKATCKAEGTRTYTAVFKNSFYKTQAKNVSIAKTKTHSWNTWKITKKATVYANGTMTRTCRVCGKKETKSIPKLKVSGTLIARATASGNTALNYKWTKVNNVSGYDIFVSRCDYNGKKYTAKRVKTISGNKTFTWTQKKLAKNTCYKAYVKAYTIKNGKKNYVKMSPLIHVCTGNARNSLTNPKSISINRTAVTLKPGKSATVKGTVTKVRNDLHFPDGHAARVRYLTTNSKVATVSSSGKITAKSKGICTIYAYAQNGLWKTCKVTVK